jgi:hypothetical protein
MTRDDSTRRGTRRLGASLMIVLAMLPLILVACDPCAGVASCSGSSPYLAATGQIVDKATGAGIDGARIDVVRRGGIGVETDSVSAVTSGGGFWRVELAAMAEGDVIVDVQVSPPGAPGYRVKALALATRPNRGDANLNATWINRPYFNYAGELFLNGTVDDRIQNRPVEFRLRSGVRTIGTGVRDSVFRAATDIGGRVELFPTSEQGGLLPLGTEDLVGDLTVFLEAPLAPFVIRNIHLSPSYLYFDAGRIARFAVGP